MNHVTTMWLPIAVLLSFTSFVTSQNDFILQSLGDHGDRITDLEGIVKTLQTQFNGLNKEVTSLRQENKQLRTEIQNLTAVCTNSQCCQCSNTGSQGQVTSAVSPSLLPVSSAKTPSTIHNLNLKNITMATTTKATSTTKLALTSLPVQSSAITTATTSLPSTTLSPSTTSLPSTTSRTSTTSPPSTTSRPSTTTPAPTVYDDCVAAASAGQHGTVNVTLGTTGRSLLVDCDTDGWLVIQRRSSGAQSFDQNWNTYKRGFGDVTGDFWLGNENIHLITSSADYTLRIEMDDWAQNQKYAEYGHFRIDNDINYYRLFVGSYSGNAGDSFHYPQSYQLTHFQQPFSTPDRDNDRSLQNCAGLLASGWWFNDCYSSNLNGKYLPHPYGSRMLGETSGQPTLEGTGIEWYPLKHHQYSLKKVVMKLRPHLASGPMG